MVPASRTRRPRPVDPETGKQKRMNGRERQRYELSLTDKEIRSQDQMKVSASHWRWYDADTRRAWNAVATQRSLSRPDEKAWTGYQAFQSASTVRSLLKLPVPPPVPPALVTPASLPPLVLTASANAVFINQRGALNGLTMRVHVRAGFDDYSGDILLFGWKPTLSPDGTLPPKRPAFVCALHGVTGEGSDVAVPYNDLFVVVRPGWRVVLQAVPVNAYGFRGTPQVVEAIVGVNP